MENCALCICDLSLLARCDPMSWDLENVFERLIPRRETQLKRILNHANNIQEFARVHTDDAGNVLIQRKGSGGAGGGGSAFDIALGSKDTATISLIVRPLYDLSAHVALSLKRFLEQYPSRFSHVNFDALRMSPLMTALLKTHVREYMGDHFVDDSNSTDDDQASSLGGDGTTTSSGTLPYNNNKNLLKRIAKTSVSEGFAPSSDADSITSSIGRVLAGGVQPIKFGPPIELLSAAPLSVHLTPYGRNAFFPELLERRRQLEMAMQVDPDGWRAVVYPPKLVAAVLRLFVSILHVPARVVLPRLAEVLPGAVKMHYQLAGEPEPDKPQQQQGSSKSTSAIITKFLIAGAQGQCPSKNELGIGLRYFARINEAVKVMCQRAHFLSADALLILHCTPHPVFGTKYESPLLIEARLRASNTGMTVVEKVDLQNQQELLQVLGVLARKYSHVFIAFEDINACGGSLSPECRLVLTRLACNKFTLLCDGTYNVGNPCASSRAHWLNSARNAPGGGCADAYVIGTGAFLSTVVGRGAVVVYSATRAILDVEPCAVDPMLPLLIDDGIVIYTELVKAMGLESLTSETSRAAQGICDDAKTKLPPAAAAAAATTQNGGGSAVTKNGIVCIPVPNLERLRAMASRGGSSRRGGHNVQIAIEAPLARSLENIGVTCCVAKVNLSRVSPPLLPGQQQQQQQVSTVSVLAGDTEDAATLCAIMTPHLQTIESVSWDLVWRALAGLPVDHPEKVPTLATTENEKSPEERRHETESRQQRALEEAKLKREKEDAELLELIKMVVGKNQPQQEGGGGGGGGGAAMMTSSVEKMGDDDPLVRDPYSYTSRLDNLLAVHDPLRAGSANAMMEGMLENAKEDFYGFKYDDSFASAVVGTPSIDQAVAAAYAQRRAQQRRPADDDDNFINDDDDDDEWLDDDEDDPRRKRNIDVVPQSSFMRRDVLEVIFLARCVLRLGREPADNSPMLIALVLKTYSKEQFEKLPVLLEAYKGRESQLLESLVQKFVPPHRRAHFRPRQMLLRAPPVPDSDVALARRMIHKCLHAHRPERIAETSSIAHLLAPLVTLIRQRQATNPLLASSSFGGGNSRKGGALAVGGVDFLAEEETDGKLVRTLLEEEVGIVPRAIGRDIFGSSVGRTSPLRGGGSSSTTGATTPAMAALLKHSGGPGDKDPHFLSRMFSSDGGGDSSNMKQQQNRGGSVYSSGSGHNTPHNTRSVSSSFLFGVDDEHRSASLAMEAAQRAEGGVTKDGVPIPSLRDRVIRLYARYDPARIPHVDELLRRWMGREELLIQSLCAKYGPEPPYTGPIRTHSRMAHQTDPALERPGALVNVMRGYYQATGGPAARAAIDDALEETYPPEETHARIARKIAENQPSHLKKDWNDL